ncbi:MAG: TonB family protein [Pseudomonadota bacterium]|jgi:protein TonB|nr:TonB family protein [Pseudomonadota bacterium]
MQFRSTRPLLSNSSVAADWYQRPNVTGLSVFTSLLSHIIIILSIGFVANTIPDQIEPVVLDFTLVNAADNPADDARLLAQYNQRGHGDASPDPAVAPLPFAPRPVSLHNRDQQQVRSDGEQRNARDALLVNPDSAIPTTRVSTSGRLRHMENDASTAQLQRDLTVPWVAEIGRLHNRSRELARHKFISANTRESIYAAYMATWRDRVQRIGNLNYPESIRQRHLTGSVVLEVVIGRNGNLLDVHIVKTSAQKVLDDTAVRLAQLAAPFAPLPPAISRQTSALHITRTWNFSDSATVLGAPRMRIN